MGRGQLTYLWVVLDNLINLPTSELFWIFVKHNLQHSVFDVGIQRKLYQHESLKPWQRQELCGVSRDVKALSTKSVPNGSCHYVPAGPPVEIHVKKKLITSDQQKCTWGFPEIGLPPVIIHFNRDFPLKTIYQTRLAGKAPMKSSTIYFGVPPWLWKAPYEWITIINSHRHHMFQPHWPRPLGKTLPPATSGHHLSPATGIRCFARKYVAIGWADLTNTNRFCKTQPWWFP